MKVAITHDYLIDFGGAERVLLALHEIYPNAPIYTSIVDKRGMGESWGKFKDINIRTTWFNSVPFASKLISPFRFLLPLVWGSLDLSKYDLIIDSSSWAITRGFKKNKKQIEICYCHTPPRYLYGYDTSRDWESKWFGGLVKIYSLLVNHFMRLYDFNSAQKVDYFIANSKNVAERIQKFYRKESVVIYPPVDIKENITKDLEIDEQYYLTGGRFVAAKNFNIVIKACIKAKVKLKIFGSGILEEELKKISNENIEFVGKVSDEELVNLYTGAKAFIVAQKDEDFGITTVEAQSLGCPVVAYRGGGYIESVLENKTGVFFDELNIENLVKAINKSRKIKWNKKVLRNNAQKFSKERFIKNIKTFVDAKV